MSNPLFKSASAQRFLDGMGAVCLGIFVAIHVHNLFLIELMPNCYREIDVFFLVNKCWHSPHPTNPGIEIYVFVSSALLFEGVRHLAPHLSPILPFFANWIFLFSIVVIARLILLASKAFIWSRRKFTTSTRQKYLLLLMLSLIPALLVSALKYYVIPPKSSQKPIVTDLWHSDFTVPRSALEKWPLWKIEKQERVMVGDHAALIEQKLLPYVSLSLTTKTINQSSSDGKTLRVTISPYYPVLSHEMLQRARGNLLDLELKGSSAPAAHAPIYAPVTKDGPWEIYKRDLSAPGRKWDLYILRNDSVEIADIFYCTSDHYYELNTANPSQAQCPKNEDCSHAPRLCRSQLSGTPQYQIAYTFDKDLLDFYAVNKDSIRSYLLGYSANAPTP